MTITHKISVKVPKYFLDFLAKKGFKQKESKKIGVYWQLDTPDKKVSSADFEQVTLSFFFDGVQINHLFYGADFCKDKGNIYSSPVFSSFNSFVKNAYGRVGAGI